MSKETNMKHEITAIIITTVLILGLMMAYSYGSEKTSHAVWDCIYTTNEENSKLPINEARVLYEDYCVNNLK